uniref:Coiled-coil domain containing 92B n=1 Tax=Leptobrachium leishanense TaxID=445787 RepID=A0A8C5LZA1_9ANUR
MANHNLQIQDRSGQCLLAPNMSSPETLHVVMETQSLERQIQSVQRNIDFLKKEQLELLHGLQQEILRLQKRSTELTQELELKQVDLFQQDLFEQEMEEKCQILAARCSEKEKLNSELKKELYHRENRVAALRSKLRDKERRFLDELKRRSHRVTILNTELQKQTEAAAYLSFQLHTTKQKLQSHQQNSEMMFESTDFTVLRQPHIEGKAKRRTHKNSSALRQASDCSGSKVTAWDTFQREQMTNFEDLEPMPDPALFLYPKRHVPRRQRSESRSCSHGGGSGATGLSTKCNERLTEENDNVPTHIPAVKAKLPKSERGKHRALSRQDSRDSE